MKRPYVSPVGECCGRRFYTWEGWNEHQLSHRSRYNLDSPYRRRRCACHNSGDDRRRIVNECPDCGCDLDRPHNEHIGLDGPDEKGPCSCENTAHTKAAHTKAAHGD